MLERVFIALFYAGGFFALGAWSGGHLQPIGVAIADGAVVAKQNAVDVWKWATGGPLEPKAPEAVVADPDAPPEAALNMARESFARGDIGASIASYHVYIEANPNSPEAWGELGNVYFNSGRTAEASQAFYSAALLLLSEGRAGRARALEPVIRTTTPWLADDLSDRLERLSSEPDA